MVKILYPDSKNQVAYHALRKRLMKHLMEFIMLKRMDEDNTTASSVMGMISLSRFLLSKREDHLAWEIIRKAEKNALQHEQYDLLNTIYNLQIEHSDKEPADDLKKILHKWTLNKKMADVEEKASIANSLITHKLAQVRLKGQDPEFDKTIDEVLETYGLSHAVSTRPRLFYNLMNITRSSVIAKKDFYNFESVIIKGYHRIEEHEGFSKHHHSFHLKLLYMIAHVLYRNKKFDESNSYLDRMYKLLMEDRKSHFEIFFPKYAMLRAANYMYSYRLDEAIEILEKMLADDSLKLKNRDTLNAYLNLGFYHFLKKNYSQSIRCNLEMNHSDKWMEKKMGKEWIIKKNLSELILQYELGNYDLVHNRIRSIERNYKKILAMPAYQKLVVYLSFIKRMVNHPNGNFADIYEDVQVSFNFLPMEQEDIQEVGFYGWLKARLIEEDYYGTLLELVRL
ncbi:MAG: hypothetical protein KDE26_06470 [Bacteroidetes bacterium]|nr:hypothetical protein [Bacteroidota bacterium]